MGGKNKVEMGKGGQQRRNGGTRGTKHASPFMTTSAGSSSSKPLTVKAQAFRDKVELEAVLTKKRLCIQEIPPDGNCLFRTLSFLLHGWANEDHAKMRADICQFMNDNMDDFAPFVEDDEGFDKYLARMRLDGTWGSQMELCAAQRSLDCTLHIYQPGKPSYVLGTPPPKALYGGGHDGRGSRDGEGFVLNLLFDGVSHYNAIYGHDDILESGKVGKNESERSSWTTSGKNEEEADGGGGSVSASAAAGDGMAGDADADADADANAGTGTDTGDSDGREKIEDRGGCGGGLPPKSPTRKGPDDWGDGPGGQGQGFMISKKEARKLAKAHKKTTGRMNEIEDGMKTIFL